MIQRHYASPPPRPRGAGLVVTALVVGIVAFALGWARYLGVLTGIGAKSEAVSNTEPAVHDSELKNQRKREAIQFRQREAIQFRKREAIRFTARWCFVTLIAVTVLLLPAWFLCRGRGTDALGIILLAPAIWYSTLLSVATTRRWILRTLGIIVALLYVGAFNDVLKDQEGAIWLAIAGLAASFIIDLLSPRHFDQNRPRVRNEM